MAIYEDTRISCDNDNLHRSVQAMHDDDRNVIHDRYCEWDYPGNGRRHDRRQAIHPI